MNDSVFLRDNNEFITFGAQHLIVILFCILTGYLFINWAKSLSKEKQFKIGAIFAISISLAVVFWLSLKIYTKGFNIKEDLPLQLCNFMAFLLPVIAFSKNKTYHTILFFWIIAGTTHALITPTLREGFPNYIFLKYWYIHAGLVTFALYSVFVYKFHPTLKSVFISFGILQIYIVSMFAINSLLGSNYFYTNHKPAAASALDFFGEYPKYIIFVEIFMIPYFLLFYLPFYLAERKK